MTTEHIAIILTLLINAFSMVYNAGKMSSTVTSVTKAINELKEEVKDLNKTLNEVIVDVAVLKGRHNVR